LLEREVEAVKLWNFLPWLCKGLSSKRPAERNDKASQYLDNYKMLIFIAQCNQGVLQNWI
jgi:hypothetical protein